VSDPFDVLGLQASATLDDVRGARRRLAAEHHPDRGGDVQRMQEVNVAFDAAVADLAARRPVGAEQRRVRQDVASFTIDALPVEAFEALLVVTSWVGEVLDDDPPYTLEVLLADPLRCWCRLDLVPDAGASTVSLSVAAVDLSPAPALDDVRDAWVASLNTL